MSAPASYYLWVKQYGEGCDYTIGCAERLIPLSISSLDGLGDNVLEVLEYHGVHPGSEKAAETIKVLKLVEELDPDNWDYREPVEEDDETEERRRLYEELKKEFG